MGRLKLLCCGVVLTACATLASPPVKATAGALVKVSEMTHHTFDKDVAVSGRSNCNGQCAATWPPLIAQADAKAAGDCTLVPREGGEQQWADTGKLLYAFLGEQKPNDMNGKGMNGVWQVATP